MRGNALSAAVETTARDAFGADWCSANDVPLHEEIVVAVRLLGVSWPYEDLEKVPAVACAVASRARTLWLSVPPHT